MAEDPDNSDAAGLNPAALPLPLAVRILSAAGRKRVTLEQIQRDIADGAPTNVDGTLNLVHYAAWLVGEMGRGD